MMRIDCSLPVPRSLAPTCTMPLASMSKVTSTWGTPRGAGGMPTRSKRPSDLLCSANSRSPCSTWIVTAFWLSAAVEKICDFLVGIVVFRSMSLVNTPPRVSMPERQRGHVEQQDVLDVALEHAALDRGADRHDFVRVDAFMRLFAEDLFDLGLNARHAGHAADQDDFVDLALRAGPSP